MKNGRTIWHGGVLAALGLACLASLAGCAARTPQAVGPTSHASDANAQKQRIERQILQTRSARTSVKRAAAHIPIGSPGR